MTVFSDTDFDNHEEILFCSDDKSGLKAIIAIHNTNRGPALGGCRMWPYNTEQEAISDVIRLSKGMTYKNSLAQLPYGGAKSVIIGTPHKDKSQALFEAMGRFVEGLNGRYIIAEDVGVSVDDMETVLTQTKHVVGTRTGGSGDPSPATAYGVFHGIRAAVQHKHNTSNLNGITVAIQGIGNVGYHLARHLKDAGAKLIISDINLEALNKVAAEFNAKIVAPQNIISTECDVLAPCALGAIINDETIPTLNTQIIAGSANNQLQEERHGHDLMQKNILYAPDYVINAGGVINVAYEQPGYDKDKSYQHIETIYDTLDEIFTQATEENIATNLAANRIAERRFMNEQRAKIVHANF
jgi:leucine dehydrogenase